MNYKPLNYNHRSAAANIERQKDILQLAVENVLDAFFLSTADGQIIHVNQSACTSLGYSYEELISMRTTDIDPQEEIDDQGNLRINGRSFSEKRGVFESYHRRKNGTIFPVEVTYNNIEYEDNEYSFAFVRDISDRKRIYREAEELRFVVEKSIDQVLVYNRDARFYYVNESACKAMGYSRDEFMKLSLYDIVPGHTKEILDQNWEYRRKGDMTVMESVHKAKDGTLIPVELSINNMIIDGTEYSCAIVRDIRERKEALQKLEMLQFAIDNSIVPFYFYDENANITYANKSACKALGYTYEELISLTVHDIDPGVTPEVWQTLYPNVKAGLVGTIPSTNKRKDGTVFPVEVTPTNMTFGEIEFGCSANLDVSERVEAEKTIRESEEKFRLIADTSPVATGCRMSPCQH